MNCKHLIFNTKHAMVNLKYIYELHMAIRVYLCELEHGHTGGQTDGRTDRHSD